MFEFALLIIFFEIKWFKISKRRNSSLIYIFFDISIFVNEKGWGCIAIFILFSQRGLIKLWGEGGAAQNSLACFRHTRSKVAKSENHNSHIVYHHIPAQVESFKKVNLVIIDINHLKCNAKGKEYQIYWKGWNWVDSSWRSWSISMNLSIRA
jgi:hypothetical protein